MAQNYIREIFIFKQLNGDDAWQLLHHIEGNVQLIYLIAFFEKNKEHRVRIDFRDACGSMGIFFKDAEGKLVDCNGRPLQLLEISHGRIAPPVP